MGATRFIPPVVVVLMFLGSAVGAFDTSSGAEKLPPIEYPDLATWQGRAADAVGKLWGPLKDKRLSPLLENKLNAAKRLSWPDPDDMTLARSSSISGEQIDSVLASYGSPAVGTGQSWIDSGERWGIDPAYALAFFIHESSAGTNPNWAGSKPDGTTTKDPGNIICAGYSTCYGRFRDYATWNEGIDDWFRLIKVEYMDGRGHKTIDDVIPVYAPASDNNDEQNYIESVRAMVSGWRQANMVAAGVSPVATAQDGTVSTAGLKKCQYTLSNQIASGFWAGGPNEPVAAWSGQYGGLHLGNDFTGAPGDPVFAPFAMHIVSVGSYDDPNDGRYGKNVQARFTHDDVLYYAGHLIDTYVEPGDFVPACTIIGTMGATTFSHVHIKLGGKDAPIPCEASEPGPYGCIDPIEYWEKH